MKLNRKWLNEEFVDLSHVSDKEFVETMTVFGQKVETWERMDAEIKNVKVAECCPWFATRTPTICGSVWWTWARRNPFRSLPAHRT